MLGSGKSLENVMKNKSLNKALQAQNLTKSNSTTPIASNSPASIASNSTTSISSNSPASSAQSNKLTGIINNLTSVIQKTKEELESIQGQLGGSSSRRKSRKSKKYRKNKSRRR
jgi:hypothetical protein